MHRGAERGRKPGLIIYLGEVKARYREGKSHPWRLGTV